MSNNEQGMSKEKALRTNVLPLLPWTFLVGHSSFNFLRASVKSSFTLSYFEKEALQC